ncbi:MAG: hypothetical protein P8Y18_04715 [Candidatus Bathyarchaeota archaeon]
MMLKVVHLWIPAIITYFFALILAFSGESIISTFLTSLYLVLLISTKWANGET